MRKFLKSIVYSAIALFSSLSQFAIAQNTATIAGPKDTRASGFIDTVIDNTGKKYYLPELAINDTVRAIASGSPTISALVTPTTSCATPGYFKLYLDPASGLVGAPGSAEDDRLQVLCAVLKDISDFINSPLDPLTISGQRVNVWVKPSLPGSSTFLGTASSVYMVPPSPGPDYGIADNAAFLTINSGIDAFTGIAPPLYAIGDPGFASGTTSTYFHMVVEFNFSSVFAPQWNTSLTSPATSSQYDLYTVLLHEIMHALGFMSLIDVNGHSSLGSSFKYWGRYDRFLYTQNAGAPDKQLIVQTPGCNPFSGYQFNPLVTPTSAIAPIAFATCTGTHPDHEIMYNGSTLQRVYTPGCYAPASSLSHFDDAYMSGVTPGSYFVMDYAALHGVTKRYPTEEERLALCDMGYGVNTSYGQSAHSSSFAYSASTACLGTNVIGITDGVTGSSYAFHTTGMAPVSISGADLLQNDYGVTTGTVLTGSVTCIKVVTGTGSISLTDVGPLDNFTYTPGAGDVGVITLSYIPVSATGEKGNLTYFYIYIGILACSNSCAIITNGNFESTPTAFTDASWAGNVSCWQQNPSSSSGAKIYSRWSNIPGDAIIPNVYPGSVTPGQPNDHFVAIQYSQPIAGVASYNVTGITQTLQTPIVPGIQYTLSFWALEANKDWVCPVEFSVSDGSHFITNPMATTPSGFTPLTKISLINDASWHQYTQTVMYTSTVTASHLTIYPAPWSFVFPPIVGTGRIVVGIDDITLTPQASVCYFNLPSSICPSDPPLDLSTLTCMSGTVTWESVSSGSVVYSHSAIFDAGAAFQASVLMGHPGHVTVKFEYTDVATGCVITITKETYINPTITGLTTLCPGGITSLSSTTPGGTWSSSNTSVVTISGTGSMTAITTGVSLVSYSLPSGCINVVTVTVISTLPPITGIAPVCVGSNIALSNNVWGGTWGSTNISIATNVSNIFHAVSSGSVTVTYSLPSCGLATATLSVTPALNPIVGATSMCVGSITSLSDASPSGTWSVLSTPSSATIDPSSGVLAALSVGLSIVSYTTSPTCYTTRTVVVNPLPANISGPSSLCVGNNILLSNATGGGIWSSSNTSVATVSYIGTLFPSGISLAQAQGISAGAATITYEFSTGCLTTKTITINPIPDAITGENTVCAGLTLQLSNAVAGGSWSVSNSSVATIDATGIVSGITPGSTNIIYTLPAGCSAVLLLTVKESPSSFPGPITLCMGTSTTLVSGFVVGTWSSSNTLIATINPSFPYDIIGVSPGVADIIYTLPSGCFTTISVSVLPVPTGISGGTSVCEGLAISFSNATTGGSWTSANTSIAVIDATTGVLTGNSAGATNISYTLTNGCSADHTVTVNPSPAIISGPSAMCVGSIIILSNEVFQVGSIAGVWSSSNTLAATLFPSVIFGSPSIALLYLFGDASGTTTITYALGDCFVTKNITVGPTPIIGATSICVGSVTTLSNEIAGGTWSSDNTSVATIDPSSGILSGVNTGSANIIYDNGLGCESTMSVSIVTPPTVIVGSTIICSGTNTTLSCPVSGGIWTSSNTSIATMDPVAGTLTGLSAGITTVTYTMASGCYITQSVSVSSGAPPIIAPSLICPGSTQQLSNAASSGTWTTSTSTVATITSTGVITAVTTGVADITFTSSSGCIVTKTITVNTVPLIPGPLSACLGTTVSLSNASAGGVWSVNNSAIATIDPSSGIISTVSQGVTDVYYQSIPGCTASISFSVTPAPVITGSSSVCIGGTITLSSGAGSWSSTNSAVATIHPTTRVVTGVSIGTAVISYISTAGCIATTTVSVLPSPGPIVYPSVPTCASSIVLSDPVSGGTWSIAGSTLGVPTLAVATIDASTGVVTPGTELEFVNVTHALPGGCQTTVTFPIFPIPEIAPASGAVCVGGNLQLSSNTSTGAWFSGNTTVAVVIPPTSYLATGVSVGSTVLTFHPPWGCERYMTLTVIQDLAINGGGQVCSGSTLTISNNTAGGTWSSNNSSVATISPGSPVVYGATAGTAVISYKMPTGCYTVKTVTVLPTPVITGTLNVCAGSSVSLSSATAGGTWSSSNSWVGTISASGTVFHGINWGSAVVRYVLPTGCYSEKTVTVNAQPSPISAAALTVCQGSMVTLSVPEGGGTWTASNTLIAGVHPLSGGVTGLTGGTGPVVITYTLPGGCYSIITVTVNPQPGFITGPTNTVCGGTTILLSNAMSGGTWTSSSTPVATINSSTRTVYGVTAGTTTITYTMPGGCYVTTVVTVNPSPVITGPNSVCTGSTIMLTSAVTGGTWSTSNSTKATVTAMGAVTGGSGPSSPGTVNIQYILPTGCLAVRTLTVNITPGPIVGSNTVCLGSSYMLALTDALGGGTWSSSNTLVATVGVTSGIVKAAGVAGSVVVTYTMPTGCFREKLIDVLNVDPDCFPCATFGGSFTTLSGTVTPVSMPAGNYYVASDWHVTQVAAITDGVIMVAPARTIYVEPTANLILNGCHLFSCEMWQGIELVSNTTTTGVVTIGGGTGNRSSLIEDANFGVSVLNPKTPMTGYLFVSCNNAIFNRNGTGIRISGYNVMSPTTYQFSIENTVFTCRDLYSTGGWVWPRTWPSTTGTAGLKTPIVSSAYLVPYFIRNYAYELCRDGLSSWAGIEATDVGNQVGSGYAGLVVGKAGTTATNLQMNLFDQLGIGIWGLNADVTSYNNCFNEMRIVGDKSPSPHYIGGIGISTAMNNGRKYKLAVEPTVQLVLTPWPPAVYTTVNTFYECKHGVYSLNYWEVTGRNSYMITSQSSASGVNSGNYGYNIQTYPHQEISLNNNTIVNVDNAISVKYLTGRRVAAPIFGAVNINFNDIRATPPGAANPGGLRYVDKAIWVDNAISSLAYPTSTAQVTVFSNTLTNVYNGVYFTGLDAQVGISNSNTIRGVPSLFSATQYGIGHFNCSKDQTIYNSIVGTSATNLNWFGVKVANAAYHAVKCNDVNTVGTGFEFENCKITSQWMGNKMTSNRRGFSMIGGQIGTQGGPYAAPADNRWLGATWGGSNVQTYMYLAPPTSSIQYVKPSIAPTINTGVPFSNFYSFTNGLLISSGPHVPACPIVAIYDGGVSSSSGHLRQIVQKQMTYLVDKVGQEWMGQMGVWRVIKQYAADLGSDAVLNDFKDKAENSRFGLLTDIENALAEGDYATAQGLLDGHAIDDLSTTITNPSTGVMMGDDPAADLIVGNYRAFYQKYINYEAQTLTASDSVEIEYLASLCPWENGPVVYKARALYDLVFDTLRIFENSCVEDTTIGDTILARKSNTTMAGVKQIAGSDGQQYKLFPNPNNGSFTLQQAIADDKPVTAELWDVAGRSIYKNRLSFADMKAGLHIMNAVPGTYLLQLIDSSGRTFRFKITVE